MPKSKEKINYKLLQDAELSQRVLQYEDHEAFKELWERYYSAIKSYLRLLVKNKLFAEDIVSDTFLKVFAKLELYNPKYNFSAWIYRIATNTAIDFYRKDKKMDIESIDREKSNKDGGLYTFQIKDTGLSPEEIFIIQQREDFLTQMLEALDLPYKNLIISKFIKQKTYEELSEETQIPVNTLKTRVRRSLLKLKSRNKRIQKQY